MNYRKEPLMLIENDQNAVFTGFVEMTALLEKLKLLQYESEHTSTLKMKPIHRYYFMISKNPGEQFYLFSSLAAWLIQKAGRNFDQPQEYDDPNLTIANILNVVREYGTSIDFPPNKLKQGFGEHVVLILNRLADETLKHCAFMWKKPEMVHDNEEETEIIEDDSEINLDRIEEEMMAAYSSNSDDENVFIDNITMHRMPANEVTANINQDMWKVELERVQPHLRITVKTDNGDWRTRLEKMKAFRSNMQQNMTTITVQLNKLRKDMINSSEKILVKEKYLHRELEPVLHHYSTLQNELSRIQETYKNISTHVAEKDRNLSNLTDKLEIIKQQMEERGSSMTDGTPLVAIKKTINTILLDIKAMDVRIGVLSCMILQSKISDKEMLEDDLKQFIKIF